MDKFLFKLNTLLHYFHYCTLILISINILKLFQFLPICIIFLRTFHFIESFGLFTQMFWSQSEFNKRRPLYIHIYIYVVCVCVYKVPPLLWIAFHIDAFIIHNVWVDKSWFYGEKLNLNVFDGCGIH
jgi:hypothetical protein